MKKKMLIIILLVIVIILILGIVVHFNNIKQPKGIGAGMFDKNSDSITFFYKGEVMLTIYDEQRDKLAAYMKEIDFSKYKEELMVEEYEYLLDFNNNWCVVYVDKATKKCYLKDKNFMYTMPEKAYTYIFDNLLK